MCPHPTLLACHRGVLDQRIGILITIERFWWGSLGWAGQAGLVRPAPRGLLPALCLRRAASGAFTGMPC